MIFFFSFFLPFTLSVKLNGDLHTEEKGKVKGVSLIDSLQGRDVSSWFPHLLEQIIMSNYRFTLC